MRCCREIYLPELTALVSTVTSENRSRRMGMGRAIAWSGLTKPSTSKASQERYDLPPVRVYSRQSLGMHSAMPSVSSIKARPFTNNAR
jgi:hypothetical protein